MNYVRFLKHHAPIADLVDDIDEPTIKTLSTIQDNSPRTSTNRPVVDEVAIKLRRKVNLLFFLLFLCLTFEFSYLIHINNYVDHLNNKI